MDISATIMLMRQINIITRFIVLILAMVKLGTKVIKEKNETDSYNIITILMMCIFSGLLWINTVLTLNLLTPLGARMTEASLSKDPSHFSLITIGMGFCLMFGLIMVFYANQWEALYFSPLFLFGGLLTFWLITGNENLLYVFITISGVITISFLIITGFRLKDNGALGLGIAFTITFYKHICQRQFQFLV